MNFIEHIYNNKAINQRPTDGYINLNQMAEATGKRVDKWIENQSTKALILEFETGDHTPNSGYDPALITDKTKVEFGGGTWAHPDIAIQFAQWCSPAFALQVSRWVRQWLSKGKLPDLQQLSEMSENQLKLERQRAVSHLSLVDYNLSTAKERKLEQAVARDKREQLEMNFDEDKE